MAEQTGAKIATGIVVLGVASNGKEALVGSVSMDLQRNYHAGNIIKKVAEIVGGSGVRAGILHKLGARTPKK
jgi:alanyl-tRNA synthetase